LVIQEGEEILAKLDAWAIPTLRSNKLIWSGWGPMQTLPSNLHSEIHGTGWGFREIMTIDSPRLRVFFLSLLWRAAATDRREFAEIRVPQADIEKLRTMIVSGDPNPLSFYPICLVQLSTKGPEQNMTPIASKKQTPAVGNLPAKDIPVFRFYFDGLIAHFERPDPDNSKAEALEKLHLGTSSSLLVSTVTYEASFQRENLERLQQEANYEWGHVLDRL
jgi:hypothetical protein